MTELTISLQPKQKIIHGDCFEKLKTLADCSIDAVVTDPPYGLSFMGKKWDYDVPSTEIWKEVLRVLKPGGHLLSFGGTRTYHRMVVNIEDAGFEIRDQIQWIYGSGFPKSHNGDHGGTALKPANEPIVMARKPLAKGLTVAQNFAKYGTGGLNIDASRVAGHNPSIDKRALARKTGWDNRGGGIMNDRTDPAKYAEHKSAEELGRWPANVIFDDEAAKVLDEQSGILKNGGQNATSKKGFQDEFIGGRAQKIKVNASNFAGDSGGASRFFYVAKASKRERNAGLNITPQEYADVSNARLNKDQSKNPNTKGRKSNPIDGLQNKAKQLGGNHHPTVKPIKLMEYLIKLVTPPGGIVLDPFCGSGSTGVAAKRLGFGFIGIEREAEYVAIAEKRMEAV